MFAVPRLFTAAAILLAGFWLSRYLGRSALVWAVNEGVPFARRWAAAVKGAILFVAVVVAAETLGFAERVFFAAFVMFVAAVALAGSIAFGLTLRSMLERSLRDPGREREEERERSLWRTYSERPAFHPNSRSIASFHPRGPGRAVGTPRGTSA